MIRFGQFKINILFKKGKFVMWEKVKEIIGIDIDKFDNSIIQKVKNNNLEVIFELGRLYE